jgi:alpha 1,2-mannosyltransferase
MSLFCFLKVALHDDRRIVSGVPAAVEELPKNEQTQAKDEQAAAVVPPPVVPLSGPPAHPCVGRPRANATLLMLARNSDLAGAVSSVSQMEDKFNKHCNYPWIFLNEEPFTEDFKR